MRNLLWDSLLKNLRVKNKKGVFKMKVYISQPMSGKTNEEIYNERMETLRELMPYLQNQLNENEDIELLDTMFAGIIRNKPLTHLACALTEMSNADIVVMMPGSEKEESCIIEHEVAVRCGLPIHYLN